MATISVNSSENIQFVNLDNKLGDDSPRLDVSAGDWQNGDHVESGVVFDVFGNQAPMLTANDARKLSKWLARAADTLDGVKNSEKKHKQRHSRHEEDDEDDFRRY